MPSPNPLIDTEIVGLRYSHQVANGTFTIATIPCVLHRIDINTAGVTDTITVYDSLTGSGTVVAVINDVNATSYVYDVGLAIGLTLVVAGTTPPDITVVYRI